MDENSKLQEKNFQLKLKRAIEGAKTKSKKKSQINSSIFMSLEDYIEKNNLKPSDKSSALYMNSFPELWPNDESVNQDVFTQDQTLKMNRSFQLFIDLLHNASRVNPVNKKKNLVD